MPLVDINTDTKELLTKRPLMMNLAQIVFDRPDARAIKAFGQFDNEQLAMVIEAKRKNVFDYGTTIQVVKKDKSEIFKYPQAAVVIRSIELALDGKFDEIDLRALGLVDESNEIIEGVLPQLCPAYVGEKPERATRSKAKLQVVQDEPAAEQAQPDSTATTASSFVRRERPSAAAEAAPVADTVLARLDALSNGMADAFTTVLREANAHVDARTFAVIDTVEARAHRLSRNLYTLNENLRTILSYLDPQASALMPSIDLPDASEPQERPRSAAVELNNETATIEYTDAELREMPLEDLKVLARGLGVQNVDKMNFRTSLVRLIKEALEQ